MSVLLIIVLVIAGLVALILILALFAKKGYSIYREIVIHKPKQEIFNYIKLLKNQDYYNKWVMRDPAMKKDFTGTDGTVGFIYAWDGNKQAGEGEQEIKAIKDGERIDIEIRFIRPFAGVSDSYITTTAVSAHQTNLKWSFASKMRYPMNAMLLFMNMDKLLGKDLETSLNTLKGILEK